MRKNKEKQIEEGIRLAWSSLESYLLYTYIKSPEGKAFHKKCIKEYARSITILSELY